MASQPSASASEIRQARMACRRLAAWNAELRSRIELFGTIAMNFHDFSFLVLALGGRWKFNGNADILWKIISYTMGRALLCGVLWPDIPQMPLAQIQPYDLGYPRHVQHALWLRGMTTGDDYIRLAIQLHFLNQELKFLREAQRILKKAEQNFVRLIIMLLNHAAL